MNRNKWTGNQTSKRTQRMVCYLLWWHDSTANNSSIPYFIESNMVNTERCNWNDKWHQYKCMYWTNRYDRLQTTLKLSINNRNGSEANQKKKKKQWIILSDLLISCKWHKYSKLSHSTRVRSGASLNFRRQRKRERLPFCKNIANFLKLI